GEWTWDAFRDIAAQATQDLNNDGDIDQWGFVGPFFDHTFPWFYANNAPTMVEEDGRMVFNGNSSAFLETLDFYKDLLLEDNVIGSGDFHESLDLFLSGKAAMRIANSFGHGLGDMEDDFGVVPLPKGPNADEYTAVAPRTNVMVVPLTVENPAEKLEVVLALYEEAEPYTDTEAKANQFWDEWATDNNIRDMESVEIFRDLNDKAFLSYSRQILEDHVDQIGEILDGEISASAQIEAITPEVQEKIDNRFN
ncbi:MAG: extracellular solute-binding protein, partial [Halanaerobiales bacterium]